MGYSHWGRAHHFDIIFYCVQVMGLLPLKEHIAALLITIDPPRFFLDTWEREIMDVHRILVSKLNCFTNFTLIRVS